MTWRTLSSAPHRLFFLSGATQAVLSVSWWACDLSARYAGIFPKMDWLIPSVWIHAFLMIYGFFPFFIFGFLMTAAPNWVNGKKVERAHYVPAFLLMSIGIALFYLAILAVKTAIAISVIVYLSGWLAGGLSLLKIVVVSRAQNKVHAYIVVGNVFMGWVGGILYLLWLFTGNPVLLHGSLTMGIWLFLLPIFLSVSHRMIPFFSSAVLPGYEPRRPYGPLFILLGGMAAHAALEMLNEVGYLWMADLPMAIVAFHLSWLWEIRRSFDVRLLAMLHIAFSWLGISMTLYAVQSLAHFASTESVLGMAPLHALTIGYFSSMVIAMVTRVTLGHSGGALKADNITWIIFIVFQSTAFFRIIGDAPFRDASYFYILAAIVWLGCFGTWNLKHVAIYWKPRSDGKPG